MNIISAGGTVAYAIECFEKGVLSERDTGGLKLTWGNHEAMMALVDMMIARQGIGDVLADGVKKAAQRIQQGSEKFAIHAGGQELAMHDSRFDPGFAVRQSFACCRDRYIGVVRKMAFTILKECIGCSVCSPISWHRFENEPAVRHGCTPAFFMGDKRVDVQLLVFENKCYASQALRTSSKGG